MCTLKREYKEIEAKQFTPISKTPDSFHGYGAAFNYALECAEAFDHYILITDARSTSVTVLYEDYPDVHSQSKYLLTATGTDILVI
jgi:hypothetical protein